DECLAELVACAASEQSKRFVFVVIADCEEVVAGVAVTATCGAVADTLTAKKGVLVLEVELQRECIAWREGGAAVGGDLQAGLAYGVRICGEHVVVHVRNQKGKAEGLAT